MEVYLGISVRNIQELPGRYVNGLSSVRIFLNLFQYIPNTELLKIHIFGVY